MVVWVKHPSARCRSRAAKLLVNHWAANPSPQNIFVFFAAEKTRLIMKR